MRAVGPLLLSFACAHPPAPAPEPSPTPKPVAIVAVFDLDDDTRAISERDAQQLADYLSVRVATLPSTRVVPRDRLRAALLEAKADSFRACVDQSCQIELGKAVAAQKSLSTKLLRVGSRCALTAALFDLTTEASERAATTQTECRADALMGAVDDIVHQLGGKRAPPVDAPLPGVRSTVSFDAPAAREPGPVDARPPVSLTLEPDRSASVVVASPSSPSVTAPSAAPAARRAVLRPIRFALGHDTLDAGAMRALDELAAAITQDPAMLGRSFEIVGHADAVERGKAELAERRARAVRKYLASRGLALGRLAVIGASDTQPAAGDASDLGRHRRVELRLVAP